MSLVIQEEKLSDSFIEESKPMLIAHWREIAVNQDIQFDPNYEAYKHMAEADMLLILTARLDSKLIGYLIFHVMPNLHYKASLQAYQDVFYVDQTNRKTMLGAGLGLLRKSEEILKERGVQVVHHHVKIYKDFSPMLEKLGYNFIEKIYQKRLD